MNQDLSFLTTVATGMDGVITIDDQLNIIFFNNYAEKLFGFTENEMLGKPLDQLLPSESVEKHRYFIKEFIASDLPGRAMAERQVIHGRHANGHTIDFEASISQTTHDGRRYCTVIMRDLTPIRKTQERILKTKTELEHNIAAGRKILKNTRARLSEVQRLSHIGIWELDIEKNALFWSDEVYEIFGLDKNTFKASYQAFLDAVHPEDRDIVDHVYQESLINKKPYQVRHRLVLEDGLVKHVEERCETFYNESGEPIRSIGTIQDITSQVTAEQQRRHLQNLLLRVEALAEVGSWEWNLETDQVFWSPEMYRQFGINPGGSPNPSFDLIVDKIHPDDKEKITTWIDTSPKSGTTNTIEYRLLDSSGSLRYLRAQGQFCAQGELCKDEKDDDNCFYGFSQDITRFKQAEQEAQESSKLLQAVLDTTHIAIAYLDNKLKFVRVNQAYANCDKKDPDYFAGKFHFDLYPNDENEKIFKNVIATGDPITVYAKPFEYKHNQDRGISHWDWSLNPVKDNKGKVKGVVLSLLDVSDRINALETAKYNEEKLKILNDHLEDAIKERTAELVEERNFTDTVLETQGALVTVINREGKIVKFNRACEQCTGYSSKEVIGKSVWDYVIPENEKPGVENVFQNLTETSLPSRYENHWLTKDGELRLIDWSNSTICDPDGIVKYVIATGIDVTERRQTEKQLARSSTSLETAQRIAKVGSWEFDIEADRLWWSDETFRIYGLNKTIVKPSRDAYLNCIHPDDVELAKESVNQLASRGHKDLVLRIVTPGGDVRIIHEMAEVEYNSNNDAVLLRGTVQDITDIKYAEDERNQLQRQLQQAQKMESIGHLTGGIAHDFNNILSVITGFTRLAITKYSKDSDNTLISYLNEINTAGNSASDLVKQMLAFSRGDTQGFKKLNPVDTITETVSMLRPTISSSIKLATVIEDNTLTIETDALQLQQTIINLVINAKDALNEKGNIEIKLHAEELAPKECLSCHKFFSGKFAAISVKDTGSGISYNIISRIFEPFFTTKSVGEGSGMGLSMVHGNVHSSGGHIHVDTRPNNGTNITLYFPLVGATKDQLRIDNRSGEFLPNYLRTLGAKILLVDDEESVAKLLNEYLEMHHFNVTYTTSSQEALELLKSPAHHFDLLVTDQAMPELTGLDLINEVKKFKPDLPIVLCSGYSDVVDESNAIEKGASYFLSKPFSDKELADVVNRLLEQRLKTTQQIFNQV